MKLKHILILQNKIDLVKEGQAKEQYEQILKFVQGKKWHQCHLLYESYVSTVLILRILWILCCYTVEYQGCWFLMLWRIVPPSSSRVRQNHNPGDQSTFRLASFSVDMKPYHCLTFFIHLMFSAVCTHCLFVTFTVHLVMQLSLNVCLSVCLSICLSVYLSIFVNDMERLQTEDEVLTFHKMLQVILVEKKACFSGTCVLPL